MEAGYFLIAILGCADGSTQCTPVMTVPTRYESEAACAAAAPATLMKHTNFDFPSLVAECRPEKPRASAGRNEERRESDTRRG
ncbi:MAG TPA: hypothetical protein VFV70_07750 [Hyphomonadaceae bacterium]|jgi:hypothetical protein|nr:hypothetical protein [Hyphomonadaceae bacterium]